MTAVVVEYVANPFASFISKANKWFQVIGYARAAGELARMGFHKEAQECIKQAAKL